MMPAAATRTKYAADRDKMVCLMLDIRGQARSQSLQVFSYSKKCLVNLPTGNYRTGPNIGCPIIRNETPSARRWAAVSVPRWLALREGLYGKPDLPPIMSGFCRDHCYDMRTPAMVRDEAERALAQGIVDYENRHRRLPGQHVGFSRSDYVSGRAFQ